MNNTNALFLKALEKYKAGDQTYKAWIEKVFDAAFNLARGNLSTHQIDPAYRELVINLVHLDTNYYSQNSVLSLNINTIKHTLTLLKPIKGEAKVIPYSSNSSNQKSDCGCNN